MADACVPNVIMNMIADKYNAHYKLKPRVTYELLWKIAHPDLPFDDTKPFPLSFDEAIPIFKYFGVSAQQRHTSGKLEASFMPETVNKNIPHSLIYIRKDNHAFPVNCEDIKQSLVNKPNHEITTQETLKCSDRFPMPSGKSILAGGVCTTAELTSLIHSHMPKNNEEKFIKVLWLNPTQDLSDLLKYMVIECRFYPNITLNGSKHVMSITLRIGYMYVSLVRPTFGAETIITQEMTSLPLDEAMRYQELKEKGLKNFMQQSD